MGERQVRQEALFYGFSLEGHVPVNHLLRAIDRFVELSNMRLQLEPYQPVDRIGCHARRDKIMRHKLPTGPTCCATRGPTAFCQRTATTAQLAVPRSIRN